MTIIVKYRGSPVSLRYLGSMQGRDGVWAGLEFASADGDSDGTFGGTAYFSCPNDCGAFVPASQIEQLFEESYVDDLLLDKELATGELDALKLEFELYKNESSSSMAKLKEQVSELLEQVEALQDAEKMVQSMSQRVLELESQARERESLLRDLEEFKEMASELEEHSQEELRDLKINLIDSEATIFNVRNELTQTAASLKNAQTALLSYRERCEEYERRLGMIADAQKHSETREEELRTSVYSLQAVQMKFEETQKALNLTKNRLVLVETDDFFIRGMYDMMRAVVPDFILRTDSWRLGLTARSLAFVSKWIRLQDSPLFVLYGILFDHCLHRESSAELLNLFPYAQMVRDACISYAHNHARTPFPFLQAMEPLVECGLPDDGSVTRDIVLFAIRVLEMEEFRDVGIAQAAARILRNARVSSYVQWASPSDRSVVAWLEMVCVLFVSIKGESSGLSLFMERAFRLSLPKSVEEENRRSALQFVHERWSDLIDSTSLSLLLSADELRDSESLVVHDGSSEWAVSKVLENEIFAGFASLQQDLDSIPALREAADRVNGLLMEKEALDSELKRVVDAEQSKADIVRGLQAQLETLRAELAHLRQLNKDYEEAIMHLEEESVVLKSTGSAPPSGSVSSRQQGSKPTTVLHSTVPSEETNLLLESLRSSVEYYKTLLEWSRTSFAQENSSLLKQSTTKGLSEGKKAVANRRSQILFNGQLLTKRILPALPAHNNREAFLAWSLHCQEIATMPGVSSRFLTVVSSSE